MQVFLLRHGETRWNLERRCQGITDIHLNETGIQQARDAAASLGKEKIHAVYSSNLKRATQTAHAISELHGLEVIPENDLRELNHGEFEGLTFTEIRASYPEFIQNWRKQPAQLLIPGGESIRDVEKRAWRAMEQILQNHHSDETVVVVSHQFPMATILCRITGTPLNQYHTFNMKPCGLVRISHDQEQGWRIIETNGQNPRGAASP